MLAGIKERRKRATLRSTSTACKRNEGRPCVLTPRNPTIGNRIQRFRNGNGENVERRVFHGTAIPRQPVSTAKTEEPRQRLQHGRGEEPERKTRRGGGAGRAEESRKHVNRNGGKENKHSSIYTQRVANRETNTHAGRKREERRER